MNHFEYSAQCPSGASITGTLEALNGVEAARQLGAMGLRNIDVRQVSRPVPRRQLGVDDFIFFNEQLASLARTGMCLDTGLRQLGKDVQSRRLKTAIDAVAGEIERGQTLDAAVAKLSSRLPALYSRVVRAGVETGQLSATLLNLSSHLRFMTETRRLILDALTYPAFVLVLAVAMVGVLLRFIVPQFTEIFEGFGTPMPVITRLLVLFANALPVALFGLAVAVGIGVPLYAALRATPSGRRVQEHCLLTIPLVGTLLRNSLRARFLRAMSFAVGSGIPLPEALRLSAGATGSPGLDVEAETIAAKVESGTNLEAASRDGRLIPPLLSCVVDSSSDGRALVPALVQLSASYESRAIHSQLLLRAWAAPVATVVVGLLIGLLVVGLFLPLTTLIRSISG